MEPSPKPVPTTAGVARLAPLLKGLSSRFCGTARMGTSISPSQGSTMSAHADTTRALHCSAC